MTRETLLLAAIQSGMLFLAIWLIFRLVPSIPANAKAWIWRIAFLKPLASLLPFAIVTLHVLPASSGTAVVITEGTGTAIDAMESPLAVAATHTIDPLLALWLLGVAVVALDGLASWVRAVQIVRQAQPVMDESIQNALRELIDRAGIGTPVELLCSPKVPSAMLVGGLRPTIVLPATSVAKGAYGDIRLMLAHEVAHLARRDLGWFSVIWAVQTLYFFNPLAWVAARCARLDHESATDRHASQLAEVPIQAYAEMLLRATVVARTSLVPGSVPMAESYRTIHRRLEAMKHFNVRPTIWRKSAVAALALGTIGLLPVYQLAEAAPSPQKPEPTKTIKAKPAIKAKVPKPPLRVRFVSPKKGKKNKVYNIELKDDRWVVYEKGKIIQVKKARAGKFISPTKTLKPTPKLKVILRPTVSMGRAGSRISVSGSAGTNVNVESQNSISIGTVRGTGRSEEGLGVSVSSSTNGREASTTMGTGISVTSSSQGTQASHSVKGTTGVNVEATHRYAIQGARASGSVSVDTVSLDFDRCDIHEALRALFRHAKKNYEIDSKVNGKVTFSLKDVTFEAALRSLLKAVDATYRTEGNTYIVTPNKQAE